MAILLPKLDQLSKVEKDFIKQIEADEKRIQNK